MDQLELPLLIIRWTNIMVFSHLDKSWVAERQWVVDKIAKKDIRGDKVVLDHNKTQMVCVLEQHRSDQQVQMLKVYPREMVLVVLPHMHLV